MFHTGGENLNRVYLHPLRAATGTVVNRSFPAGQMPGETVDHPHHAGLFYGHGDVNGFNFWAIQNVERAPAPPAAGEQRNLPVASAATPSIMGRIVPKGPVTVKSGKTTGTIDAVLSWLKPDGQPLLTETRTMTFHAHPTLRIIDVDIDLLADRGGRVPRHEGGHVRDAHGHRARGSSGRRQAGAPRRTGRLVNSRGGVGEKNVWGKQAEWVDYAGTIGSEPVGVVMMDHPSNPRHPTYWHSRGYGLHAINPFGLHDFLNDKTQNGGMTIEPGQHVRFRYRVVIHPGLSAEKIAALYKDYMASQVGPAAWPPKPRGEGGSQPAVTAPPGRLRALSANRRAAHVGAGAPVRAVRIPVGKRVPPLDPRGSRGTVRRDDLAGRSTWEVRARVRPAWSCCGWAGSGRRRGARGQRGGGIATTAVGQSSL